MRILFVMFLSAFIGAYIMYINHPKLTLFCKGGTVGHIKSANGELGEPPGFVIYSTIYGQENLTISNCTAFYYE